MIDRRGDFSYNCFQKELFRGEMKKKVGRNDPCPCGSGKKFKKCCEKRMLGGKFMATKIDTTSSGGKLSSVFQVNSGEKDKKGSGLDKKRFTVSKPKEKQEESDSGENEKP